ncbi:MAG: bifunctional riboflavin kinase/FAD synthetase [Prolixibacteraceae bacterium]|nr:bifunctional riboflavin kinase/FAD synthetase [Prolixibacteraceae bacterium]
MPINSQEDLKIHYDIDFFNATFPVVTIGTFDGVHLGHRKVISRLNEIAREVGGESVIFTFYPHPRLVVSANESNLRLLSSFTEKAELLEKAGVNHLVVFPFTIDFAEMSYEEFIREILIGKMNIHTLVVGHDHRLGKKREGSYENILALQKKLSFNVEKIDTFILDEVDISSSKIRAAIQNGDIDKANSFLGYNYSIQGIVAEGKKIGRGIGFPTANLICGDTYKLIPVEGVYAVTVCFEDKKYKGMMNIGFRPTFKNNADHRTIEVNIFDFDQDIYQKQLTIFIHKRIREERKFPNIYRLKDQLIEDKAEALKILAEVS